MISLTENIIRAYTTPQSFERGREIYRLDALRHTIRDGNTLLADCEGTDTYHLRVELDEGGIRSSVCTCPVGGRCKHLVALLLTYLHKPSEFTERKGIAVLLENVEKADLVALLVKIAAQHPEFYDWIETALPPASTSPKTGSQPRSESRVSEQVYRKRIRNILRVDGHGDYGATYGVSQELDAVSDSVEELLQTGDAQGAVTVLLVLLEELSDSYENFDDSDGELGDSADHAGHWLAEAILSADWTPAERKTVEHKLDPVAGNLAGYGIEDGLELAQLALQYGWNDPEDGEEDLVADLDQAKLNILERQGDSERFLNFCQQHGEFLRYALKLLELGRVEDAIRAANQLSTPDEILLVARSLREANRLQDAISLAERGLMLEGQKYHLAAWLAPLEESRGRLEQALQAQSVLFTAMPSLESYQNIQRLAGERWNQLRPQQMEIALKSASPGVIADIYLYEEQWDQAIAIADKHTFGYTLREKVADAVIAYRPEWVIQISIQEAEKLIEPTQSKYYPHAARWLAKAKQAYIQTGRKAEWLAYFTQLKATYARRPSLQKELARL